MLEENDQMLNIVPVAPEDKLEKNIEFGFEHELFEAEKIEQNNNFDNINSALIKTYGKKVFKLNPYKDLNPVSIENVNIQLNDSNGFLSGEVKAKVLDETLNDRSNFIKTPLINDIIVDYEADKEGCQKRYDYTIELLKNENNKELREAQAVEFQDIHSSAEEIGLQDLEEIRQFDEEPGTQDLEETKQTAEVDETQDLEETMQTAEVDEIQDLEEAKQLAEDIAEQRNELENKISDFDEVQTYISNDIETSPILEDDIVEAENEKEPELFNGLNTLKPEDILFELPKLEEDVIDIRYQLEKASVNYYVFGKYKEKPVIKEEVELVEETIPEKVEIVQVEPMEHIIDISDMVQQTSTKFYEEKERKLKEEIRRQREEEIRKEIERLAEEIRIEQERQEEARRIEAEKQAELRRKEKEELENKIVDDILNSIEESFKIDEAKKLAEECDLRIPSDVYILSVQNFIPLPDEPTPEMKVQMERSLIGIEKHLDELPLIVFRDEDEELEDNTQELANSYEQVLEQYEEPEYYIAPLQDFNLDDTLGRVEETVSFENETINAEEQTQSQRTRSGDISYEDIEEAFFNIKTVNETVAEVEKEANELGLYNNNDSGISLAKAAKIEALVEKKKAERKIKLAEERLQAELEKQQLEEKIKAIQNKINLVKQMNLADFENEEIIEDIKPVETPIQEPIQAEVVAAAAIPKVETTIELPVKRGRGRPAGSKNKKTLLREAREKRKLEKLGLTEMPVVKRKRGRPLGSKNKKK